MKSLFHENIQIESEQDTSRVPSLRLERHSGEDMRSDDADIAVRVRDVSKVYRIYNKPEDRLKQMLFWRFGRTYGKEFWALQSVSFDIYRGETLSIIGQNGSGKSTLLQIIAGTLAPSSGSVEVRGRVAALLELGSGFNLDFTGRENVYLNAAILGLSRDETDAIYDDIVGFADIGQFIDQPVKLYSSGMQVRLAFAVQAFVPKDVLIVDEALAVGDMFFQAKCMARMKQLIEDGVSVLFVSHDLGAVKSLCRRAILLNQGTMHMDGSASAVVERYFALKVQSEQYVHDIPEQDGHVVTQTSGNHPAFRNTEAFEQRAAFQRIQNGKAQFANVQLLNEHGVETTQVTYDQQVTLRMAVRVLVDLPQELAFGYHIRDSKGVDIVYSDSVIEHTNIPVLRQGDDYVIEWTFRTTLRHGNYSIVAVLSVPIDMASAQVDFCDFVPLAAQFTVEPRQESYLYGSVHWENTVAVHRLSA